MKNIVDDPQFTAWLLGELSSAEAEEMERAVAADPALQLAAREQQQFLKKLTHGLGGEVMSLDARQRAAILRSARQAQEAEQKIVALPQVSPFRGWAWASLATAAALVLGVWVALQGGLGTGKPTLAADDITREIALLPRDAADFPATDGTDPQTVAVGGSQVAEQRDLLSTQKPNEYLVEMAKKIANEPLPTVNELPAQTKRGFVSATTHPHAALPVHAGTASWNWVKRSILEQKTLPHPRMVRVEELINAFGLSSGQTVNVGGVEMLAEAANVVPGSNQLRLAVSLKNPMTDAAHVTWRYETQGVERYRLCGFASPSLSSKKQDLLASGESTTLLLEISASTPIAEVGELVAIVNGQEKRLRLTVNKEPSPSLRLLALVADFGDWLQQAEAPTDPMQQQLSALETELSDPRDLSALAIIKQAWALKRGEN